MSDTPPTAVLGDAELWGQCTDAVLFVERQNFIYAEDINTMLDKFRSQHTRVLGVCIKQCAVFRKSGKLYGGEIQQPLRRIWKLRRHHHNRESEK